MAKSDWLTKRSRGVHLTIRDVDCLDFDTERFAKDLSELGVNVLSFLCRVCDGASDKLVDQKESISGRSRFDRGHRESCSIL